MDNPQKRERWTFGDVIGAIFLFTFLGAILIGLMLASSEVRSWFSGEAQTRAITAIAFVAFLWLWHRVDKLEREVRHLRGRLDRSSRNGP